MNDKTDSSSDLPSFWPRQMLMGLCLLLLLKTSIILLLTGAVSKISTLVLIGFGVGFTINFFGIFVQMWTLSPERKWAFTMMYFLKGCAFQEVAEHVAKMRAEIEARILKERAEELRIAQEKAQVALRQQEARERSLLLEQKAREAKEEAARVKTEEEALQEQARVMREQAELLAEQAALVAALRARAATVPPEQQGEAQQLLSDLEAQATAKPRAFRKAAYPLERFLERVSQ